MDLTGHTPAPDAASSRAVAYRPLFAPASAAGRATRSLTTPRLQAIHDLVWSGGYEVSAWAIADRIVERMIEDRRGPRI
jgi:hypothetical protein